MNGYTLRLPTRRSKACLANPARRLSLWATSMRALSMDPSQRKMNPSRIPGLWFDRTISAAKSSLSLALNQAENVARLRRGCDLTAHLAGHLCDALDQIRIARSAQLRVGIISETNGDMSATLQR